MSGNLTKNGEAPERLAPDAQGIARAAGAAARRPAGRGADRDGLRPCRARRQRSGGGGDLPRQGPARISTR